MFPCDLLVMLGRKKIDERRLTKAFGRVISLTRLIRYDRRRIIDRFILKTANHLSIKGDADNCRKEAFRDAVRHVDAEGFTPFGDEIAAADHQPGRLPAIFCWTK